MDVQRAATLYDHRQLRICYTLESIVRLPQRLHRTCACQSLTFPSLFHLLASIRFLKLLSVSRTHFGCAWRRLCGISLVMLRSLVRGSMSSAFSKSAAEVGALNECQEFSTLVIASRVEHQSVFETFNSNKLTRCTCTLTDASSDLLPMHETTVLRDERNHIPHKGVRLDLIILDVSIVYRHDLTLSKCGWSSPRS